MRKFNLFILLTLFVSIVHAQQNCSTATSITPTTICNFTSHTTISTEYWLKFVASNPTVNISLVTVKFGINATHIHNLALYSGNCSSPILVADDELPFVADAKELDIDLNASGLTIGQTYYLKASRIATHTNCDKAGCTNNGSSDPTTFNICVEDIDVFIPLDFGLELPSISHSYTTNRGQLIDENGSPRPEIKLYTINANPQVYIADDKVSYVFSKIDSSALDTLHRVDMTLVGGNTTKVFKTEQAADINNFYLAHIPLGVTKNKSYSRAVCNNVYTNIDMQFYSNAVGLKYYFIVRPEGDADDIRLKFDGASSINVAPNGSLDIVTPLGVLDFEPPHVYRINPAGNPVPMPWQGKFEAIPSSPNEVKFDIQNYPKNQTLIIQVDRGHQLQGPNPVTGMCWSTYFSGNNSETPWGITNDNLGNTFITGGTTSNVGFPSTVGPIFTAGGQMIFVSKFLPNNKLEWSTFYGGTDDQVAYDIKTNSNNTVYVVGATSSADFPVLQVAGKYFDGTLDNGGTIKRDGFVATFDNNLGFNIWSTFLGGSNIDDIYNAAFDNNDNFYIIGRTLSNLDFPTMNLAGAYTQAYGGGGTDAFIAKFNTADALVWNTFVGGNQTDIFSSINIDGNNNVFISGETSSPDFPTVNPFGGAFFDGTLGGSQDQNLLKFSPTSQLLWSTYIGGSNSEYTFFGTSDNRIDFDSFNNIYLVGFTKSTDFPVFQSTGFYDGTASTSNGYIMKFSTSNLSRLWSSYINGTGEIYLSSVAVDKVNNNVYVAGTTSDNNIPLIQNSNVYFQNTLSGQFSFFTQDACFFGFNDNNGMVLGTYFGGYQQAIDGEFIMDMSITNQKLYFTGFTSAQSPALQTPFPLFDSGAPAYYDDVYNGGSQDAFVSEICVDLITSVQDVKNNLLELTIYPNPSSNSITVEFSEKGNKQISIYNIEGRLISTYFSDKNKMEISIQNMAKGNYIIKVISDATVQTAKFIKQ